MHNAIVPIYRMFQPSLYQLIKLDSPPPKAQALHGGGSGSIDYDAMGGKSRHQMEKYMKT